MSAPGRWRLVLGRFAAQNLPATLDAREARMERALDFLYSREYLGRGVRDRTGSLDPSQLSIPTWIGEVRELFPRDVVLVIERHALDRYGLTELVTDPATLEKLEPNLDLLRALLTFRGHLKGDILHTARRVVRRVAEELRRKLEPEVRRALTGRINPFRHAPHRVAQNFDWRRTVHENLKHYDRDSGRIILHNPRFLARNARFLPYHLILCVDQSGSMADSVIHSAVLAGILSRLPLLRVKLVLFDTQVVDLSEYADDPVEILMSVQLGGGTDIGRALSYCEGLVESPHRTVLALISDFCEGASPDAMLGAVRRLREGGVTLIGLASLDQTATPAYDRLMGERLADLGMKIAALTPVHFAQWLAGVIHK